MTVAKQLLVVMAIAASHSADARTFAYCHTDDGTNKVTCIDEAAVAVNGDLRSSPIYSGGPKGVSKTPYFIVTDCAKGISTLQDARGVNFAGGTNTQTPAMRTLSDALCSVRPARKDSKLRQF